jgi:peroxiredoxin
MIRRTRKTDPNNVILLIIGAGLILISLAAYLSIPRNADGKLTTIDSAIPAEVNYTAPEVALTDLNGEAVSLADFRGQVILYNAWATWCPPCKQEMPVLEAYYRAHRDQGFAIVAIEDGEPVEEVRKFAADYGLTFYVWPDPTYVASIAFGVEALPTSFVIDRNGVVRLTWSGAISRELLEQYVTPLFQE